MPEIVEDAAALMLDTLPEAQAREVLLRCCGSRRWVAGMLGLRPFRSREALFASAERVWSALDRDDFLEAFSHHPAIGEDMAALRAKFASTATLSASEQAGMSGADEPTLLELRARNRAYRERFGFIFIVCASGKTAPEMLELLKLRLENQPELELAVAAAEQAKITALRLARIGL